MICTIILQLSHTSLQPQFGLLVFGMTQSTTMALISIIFYRYCSRPAVTFEWLTSWNISAVSVKANATGEAESESKRHEKITYDIPNSCNLLFFRSLLSRISPIKDLRWHIIYFRVQSSNWKPVSNIFPEKTPGLFRFVRVSRRHVVEIFTWVTFCLRC